MSITGRLGPGSAAASDHLWITTGPLLLRVPFDPNDLTRYYMVEFGKKALHLGSCDEAQSSYE